MKKFVLILSVLFVLHFNVAKADKIPDNIEYEAHKISIKCGPPQTDDYVPDLLLKKQYITANKCLTDNIRLLAKDIFNDKEYKSFCRNLDKTYISYSKVLSLLNEEVKGVDGLPGTLDQLQTNMKLHDFLIQLLEIVIYRHTERPV